MKWVAIFAFIAAIAVRFAWHSSFDLGFHLNSTMHRGYPVSSIVFWLLLVVGLSASLMAFLKWRR
jgi:hypothetical protein